MRQDELYKMKMQITPTDDLIKETTAKIAARKNAKRHYAQPKLRFAAAALMCCVLIAAGAMLMQFFRGGSTSVIKDVNIEYFRVDGVRYDDFESLLSACELIVYGTVTGSATEVDEATTDRNGKLPITAVTTEYEIRVDEVIYGERGEDNISVAVCGGDCGGVMYAVEDGGYYREGGQYVIFLTKDDGEYAEVSPYQGKIRIENDNCVLGEYVALGEILPAESGTFSLDALLSAVREYDVMNNGDGAGDTAAPPYTFIFYSYEDMEKWRDISKLPEADYYEYVENLEYVASKPIPYYSQCELVEFFAEYSDMQLLHLDKGSGFSVNYIQFTPDYNSAEIRYGNGELIVRFKCWFDGERYEPDDLQYSHSFELGGHKMHVYEGDAEESLWGIFWTSVGVIDTDNSRIRLYYSKFNGKRGTLDSSVTEGLKIATLSEILESVRSEK